jgi:tetratricopeptide (TPR) repeat protein
VPLPEPVAARGALAIVAVLALLTLARAVVPFVPSMWLWGLGLLRFVPPVPGWALWALSALALIPAATRPLAPALERAGEAIARAPLRATAAAAAGAAALVALLPDRLQLVGDYLMRLGTARGEIPTDLVFPQALPLDLALHHDLPMSLARTIHLDANDSSRWLGAIEAALLAAFAVAFARALRLRGAAALAVVAAATLCGALGIFTGFAKAFSELSVIVAAFAVLGIVAVVRGRGLLALSLAACAAFALHRSALVFLPALVTVWILWFRAHGAGGAWKRPVHLAAFALPVLTLAFMAPRIRAAMASIDRLHVAREGADPAHVLGAALRPQHLLDLANLMALLAPLALLVPVLAPLLGLALRRRAEGWVLLALALPFVALMLFIHPRQGVFRDWDVFAAGLVALSFLAAWLIGETLRAAPRHAWLAPAVIAAALAPTAQWLLHNHDPRRGFERVEAYLAGPPRPPDEERALLLSYLGVRYQAFGRGRESVDAYTRAAALAPSPRILFEWAMAASENGDDRKAQEILRRMVAGSPDMLTGWLGLAIVSYRIGDAAEARRAALRALELRPGLSQAEGLLRALDRKDSTHVQTPG